MTPTTPTRTRCWAPPDQGWSARSWSAGALRPTPRGPQSATGVRTRRRGTAPPPSRPWSSPPPGGRSCVRSARRRCPCRNSCTGTLRPVPRAVSSRLIWFPPILRQLGLGLCVVILLRMWMPRPSHVSADLLSFFGYLLYSKVLAEVV